MKEMIGKGMALLAVPFLIVSFILMVVGIITSTQFWVTAALCAALAWWVLPRMKNKK